MAEPALKYSTILSSECPKIAKIGKGGWGGWGGGGQYFVKLVKKKEVVSSYD